MIIKEFVASGKEVNILTNQQGINLTEMNHDDCSDVMPGSLMVEIEGIHAAPFATRNFTRYMPKCLEGSVSSWTKPYRIPLIKHHNEYDGEIIGRICKAEYVEQSTSGTPALRFTVNVPGAKAMEEIKSGLLATTSIGALADDVRCSICGQQLAFGERCDHVRGETYDNNVCYWDIHSMEAKELSYVIVPSDQYSMNMIHYPAQIGSPTSLGESLNESMMTNNKIYKGEDLMENEKDLKESTEAQEVEHNEATIESLEKQLKDLAESIKAVSSLEARIDELEKFKVTEANKDNDDALDVKEDDELSGLKLKVAELTEALEQEKALKEQLETSLSEMQEKLHKSLIESVVALHLALDKQEVTQEELAERTEESLSDTIADLKEELQAKLNGDALKENVDNPTLVNDDKVKVKESLEESLDLKAELYNIFNDVLSTHK